MKEAKILLKKLEPELLYIFSSCPDFGSIGLNIVIHNGKIVRIDNSRTVTMKVSKEEKQCS